MEDARREFEGGEEVCESWIVDPCASGAESGRRGEEIFSATLYRNAEGISIARTKIYQVRPIVSHEI
jgi:hypothetical protein